MPTTTGKATDFITFTRASNATVTDADGRIKWAPHNLLTNSESFDAAAWGKNNVTVAGNGVAAPNGTTTADTLTSTGILSWVQQAFSIAATVTCGVYAKAGTNSALTIRVTGAGNGYQLAFTLTGSGSAGSASVVGTGGTVSGMTGSVTALSDGWYYCAVTFADTGGSNFVQLYQTATSGTIHLWGAHLYRSDLGMQANTSAYPMYNPTTPKNLLGYSEDFSNAAWTKSQAAIVADQVIAPNGLQTADFLREDSTNNPHRIFLASAVTLVVGTRYSHTVYAKAGTRSQLFMRVAGGGSDANGALFDLSAQTATAVGTIVSTSITAVGDGWFRCSLISAATGTSGNGYIGLYNGVSLTYQGDGVSGLYIWGAQLSDSASLDAYVPSYGAAPTSAAYYGPRRDFDPVTLACKGLLVEEQRVNLLLHSAAFDVTATWTNVISGTGTNSVRTADAGVSPNGTSTADRLQLTLNSGTTSSDAVRVRQSATPAATAHTFSVWLKSYDGVSTYTMGIQGVGSQTITVTGQWQRFVFSFTGTGSSTGFDIFIRGGQSPAHSDSVDVLAWGAQLEAGSFATSYIPTGAATATRTADVASVSTQAFPYSASEGSFVVAGSAIATNREGKFLSITDGTASGENNCFTLDVLSTNKTRFVVAASGSTQASFQSTASYTANSIVKIAGAYKQNDFGGTTNGEAITSDTTGNVPSVNIMEIGFHRFGSPLQWINGHIRQITYLPRRISNAELQTRTA